jgi:predicted amidohydrolase
MVSTQMYVAAAVNFKSTFCQPEENARRMVDWVDRAVHEEPRTRLIVFPECATTGLPGPGISARDSNLRLRFLEVAERVPGGTSEHLGEAARRHQVYIAAGFVELDDLIAGTLYNSSMLLGPDGGVAAIHRKVHTDGIFTPGDRIVVHETELGRVGLSICYDLWFPEFLRLQVLQGCQVHINLTANQPVFGIGSTHVPIVRAAENGVYVVSANRVGDERSEGGMRYMGASSVVAPLGEVLAMGDQEREELVMGEIDLDRVARTRLFLPVLQSRRTDLYEVVAAQRLGPVASADAPSARS